MSSPYKHVCSLSQAISILTAGVEQKTMFYWQKLKDGKDRLVLGIHLSDPELMKEAAATYPAYTSSELMLVMGDNIAIWKEKGQYCVSVHASYYPLPQIQEGNQFFIVKSDHSAAESLAAMLIILRKNNML